jgi:predicted SprT family Zn-dependent metalloprotease
MIDRAAPDGVAAALAFGGLPGVSELKARASALFATFGVADRIGKFEIVWCGRLRTSAGRAELERRRILLNPRLLLRVPGEIEKILAHEAAHLAVHALHGHAAKPHGAEWAELMLRAGHAPETCHRYPVAGLGRRRFYYLHVCVDCGGRAVRRRSLRMECRRCPGRDTIRVLRAPRSSQGLARLRGLSLDQIRSERW